MSGSLLDDSGAPSSYPGVFAFEFDFGGTLRCIPMSVRLKLDQVGIKLSLKQWNKMPSEERRYLVEAPCDDPADMDTYRRRLRALIEKFTASPVEEVPVDVSPPWGPPPGPRPPRPPGSGG